MDETTERFFGLTIAYVLPGFVSLWGASSISPILATWLTAEPQANPAIGGFLYALLASLAAGLIISAVRWALIDSLHHCTGLPFPNPDFSKVHERLEGFELAVQLYYRYFQFYANMFIAIAFAQGCRVSAGVVPTKTEWAVVLLLEAILLAASRDSLSRYYARITQLLGTRRSSVKARKRQQATPVPPGEETPPT